MTGANLGGTIRTAASWTHLTLDRRSPTYWRVTFDHPPINTITATTVTELGELVDLIEATPELNVLVFGSANPAFFLAHYDTEGDPARTASMPPGPTGMHPWLDFLARLSRAPVVSIAEIRGRARGAGSELVLACDLRFAARDTTLIGQFEVGAGLIPGGGPMARLSRLVGRGRALEVLLVADDLDGPRAELFGYVNRAVPDDALATEVEAIASRLARFDHEAIARTKGHVDRATLPSDDELGAALPDFFAAFGRPGPQARQARLTELGLNTDGDLERNLGRRVVEAAPDGDRRASPVNKETIMAAATERSSATTDNPTVVDSSVTATIDCPLDKIDIPAWCYGLPDAEYQACSPAHVAAGATTAADGRRMSINVEVIGGSTIVQHYVEEIGAPDHLRLVSHSDLFTPAGRTYIDVIWDLQVRRIDDAHCEFTNTVHSSAPPELQEFLARQGLPFEAFAAARRPNSEAHNRQETPMFAKSIERHALARG